MVLQTCTGEIKCPKFKNFQYIWQIKDANIDKDFLNITFHGNNINVCCTCIVFVRNIGIDS